MKTKFITLKQTWDNTDNNKDITFNIGKITNFYVDDNEVIVEFEHNRLWFKKEEVEKLKEAITKNDLWA